MHCRGSHFRSGHGRLWRSGALVRDPCKIWAQPGLRTLLDAVFPAWWRFQPTSHQPWLFIFRGTDSTAVQRGPLSDSEIRLSSPFLLGNIYKVVVEDNHGQKADSSRVQKRFCCALHSFLFPLRGNIMSSRLLPRFLRPIYNETMIWSFPWPWRKGVFLLSISTKTLPAFRLGSFCKSSYGLWLEEKWPGGSPRKHWPFVGTVSGRALWHDAKSLNGCEEN